MSAFQKIKLGLICNLSYGKNLATILFKSDGFDVFGANGVIGKYDKYTNTETEVLVSSRGENSGVINLSNPKSYITNNSIICSLKKDIDKKFLYYALKTVPRRSFVSGSAQPQVVIQDLEKIEFLVPESKPEQTCIAEILSTADEAITHIEALIAKYQRIKTGLMQDLLTKGIDKNGNIRSKETHRFVVKNGIEVPEEWEVDSLKNITRSTITYGIVQAGPDVEGGTPYIRTGDMSGDVLSDNGLLRTSFEIASKFKRSQVEEGDIVFALRATIGKVLIVPKELSGANLTQGTARIAPNLNIISNLYLLWTMRMSYFTNQILQIQKGTTFFEITLGELRQMIVTYPRNIEEQARIINTIERQESTILNLKYNLNKLQSLKTGLMQDLLSGKVKIKIDKELETTN
jgi:type I restriction enzyme S subunit